jgi:hypothetical protein
VILHEVQALSSRAGVVVAEGVVVDAGLRDCVGLCACGGAFVDDGILAVRIAGARFERL